MTPRRIHRSDNTQSQIVEALRRAGVSVLILGGEIDALAGVDNVTYILDFKSPGGRLTARQREIRDNWRGGPVIFPATPEEALAAVGRLAKEEA